VGFEPTEPCGSPVFKTGAIDHSATPPLSAHRRRNLFTPQDCPSVSPHPSHQRLKGDSLTRSSSPSAKGRQQASLGQASRERRPRSRSHPKARPTGARQRLRRAPASRPPGHELPTEPPPGPHLDFNGYKGKVTQDLYCCPQTASTLRQSLCGASLRLKPLVR
jgi:hypothetical protein